MPADRTIRHRTQVSPLPVLPEDHLMAGETNECVQQEDYERVNHNTL